MIKAYVKTCVQRQKHQTYTWAIPLLDSMGYFEVYFTPKIIFFWTFLENYSRSTHSYQVYLHNALSFNNLLNVNIKVLCYKQPFRPMKCYTFPIWSCNSSFQMEKLCVSQRKILRSCINYTRKPNGKPKRRDSITYKCHSSLLRESSSTKIL